MSSPILSGVYKCVQITSVAGAGQHSRERRLGHRSAVKAVHVGDEDFLAQPGLIGDAVDARSEGLHPLEVLRFFEHVARHVRAEGDQDLGRVYVGIDLAVVIDHVETDFGESFPDVAEVLHPHRLGKGEHDQHVRHGGMRKRACGKNVNEFILEAPPLPCQARVVPAYNAGSALGRARHGIFPRLLRTVMRFAAFLLVSAAAASLATALEPGVRR